MVEIFQEASQMIQDGLNSIVANPSVTLLNLIVFVIMIFIVRKFLWQKVTDFIEKRQHALVKEFEDAEEQRKIAHELQQKAITEYENMHAETESLKQKLVQDAYHEQEKLINDAKAEAKQRLAQAEKDIQSEIERANEDIRQSIKEVAFAAAEKIVKHEINRDKHQALIDEIIEERDNQ